MNEERKISPELVEILNKLNKDYPLVPFTDAGRLYSTVSRMTAEKDMNIPINLRSGFAVSTNTGKHSNEMENTEWNEFYTDLSSLLETRYPSLHKKIFGKKE